MKGDQVKVLLYDSYLTHFFVSINFLFSVKWLHVCCTNGFDPWQRECFCNLFNFVPGETQIAFPLVKYQESAIKQTVLKGRAHTFYLYIHALWHVNESKKQLCFRQFKQVSYGLHHITCRSLICPHGEYYWLQILNSVVFVINLKHLTALCICWNFGTNERDRNL